MKKKRLFVDKISSDFDPENDLVLGPWCLKNNFSLKEINEFYNKGVYLFNKQIDEVKAFKCCEMQHERVINKISEHVKSINKNKYSLEFYENYINNWFIWLIHLVHYGERIINEYISKYKEHELEIILFHHPKNIHFKNTEDFISKILMQHDFFANFLLFLLIKRKPLNWNIHYYEHKNINELENSKNGYSLINYYFKKIIDTANRLLAPRVRSVYGLNLLERAIISLILIKKKTKKKSFPFRKYSSNIKECYDESPISDKNLLKIAIETLPNSLKEIYKKKNKYKNVEGKIILCSAASLLVDDNIKFDLLNFKENGGRIFSVQHGGDYGNISLQRGFIEYGVDKFISWGQKFHENYNSNFQPLPSPQLKSKYENKSSEQILFVSTAHFYYYPLYVKCQSFDDSFNRIEETVTFLNELDNNLLERINYKTHVGQFSEKAMLKEKFNSLKFIDTTPEKNLNNARLVVLNNFSTFFFKSLAANAPTLCFCKKDCWKITKHTSELYDELFKVGIMFYDPKSAAQKIIKEWNTIDEWWYSKDVQSARLKLCNEFALKDEKWLSKWITYFNKDI